MAFPLSPLDGEVFTSSATGKAYKYSELINCWLRHTTVKTIDFIQKPVELKVNVGDFNSVTSNNSVELYVLPTPKRLNSEFNTTNQAFTYKYRTYPVLTLSGDFNSVSSNSSTELYVLPTQRASEDEFNTTNLPFTYKYKPTNNVVFGGDFNSTIGNY